MSTPRDDDDVLPEQRGLNALEAEIAERRDLQHQPAGRRLRLRSWGTILVGLLIVAACYWLFTQTR
jgi:hypothetical protein